MARKVYYEFKTDKRGRKYANRIDAKTGKKQRIAYKLAQKRERDIRYRERKKEVEKEGVDWEEYQKEKKEIKKVTGYKGDKLHKETIKKIKFIYEGGELLKVRTRIRFQWKWWEKPYCNTPQYEAYADAQDGDHYDRMVDMAESYYNDIMMADLCEGMPVEGGSCVVLYEKPKKGQKIYNIIKMHELGDGCVRGIERGM